jgi:hypothetical protein
LAESFANVAESIADTPTCSVEGAFTRATVIAGLLTVKVAVPDFVESLVEVAVIVTTPPLGSVAGAV